MAAAEREAFLLEYHRKFDEANTNIITTLGNEAPPDVAPIILNYKVDKSHDDYMSEVKQGYSKDLLLQATTFLKVKPRTAHVTTIVKSIILGIQNFFNEKCEACGLYYAVQHNDVPTLRCIKCGQGCHEVCYSTCKLPGIEWNFSSCNTTENQPTSDAANDAHKEDEKDDSNKDDDKKLAEMEAKLATLTNEFKDLKRSFSRRKSHPKAANTNRATAKSPAPKTGTTAAAVEDSSEAVTEPPDLADIQVTQFEDLSKPDRSRTINFGKCLRTLTRMPKHTDSLIIADSNGKKLNKDDVDPSGHMEIRYTGGLCLVSTVHGLKHHKRRYTHIKHVYYFIGTNDALHHDEHATGERSKYFQLLHRENQRIFPNAKVSLLLPPPGIQKVDIGFIEGLSSDLKAAEVPIKAYRAPSMRGKVMLPNKVHLTQEGVDSLTDWLAKILPRRPRTFSSNSGRRSNEIHNSHPYRGPVFDVDSSNSDSAAPYLRSVHYTNNTGSLPPTTKLPTGPPNRAQPQMVKEVLDFVSQLMAQ